MVVVNWYSFWQFCKASRNLTVNLFNIFVAPRCYIEIMSRKFERNVNIFFYGHWSTEVATCICLFEKKFIVWKKIKIWPVPR